MCIYYPTSFFLYVLLFPILMQHCSSRDCLKEGSMIRDGTSNINNTLVSPGEVFELGFFTPGGNNNKGRFLGIWYHKDTYNDRPNSKIIMWVANRDKPLLDSSGSLIVEYGNAKVMDIGGVTYWSAKVAPSSNASYCLQDTGNLIFRRRGERGNQVLWQSFDHPTDTFLQGMKATEITLTSWKTSNNPALDCYLIFPLGRDNKLFVVKNESLENYWESPIDQTPPILSNLLLNNISEVNSSTTRLVMNFTGQVQFWRWESERGWSLSWTEPKDRCVYKRCGNFGSCNSDNGLLCKCLPGFVPNNQRTGIQETSWRDVRQGQQSVGVNVKICS